MLSAPSRLTNPNWQGLRHGESPNFPVKQDFYPHTHRERRGALLEQRPVAHSQCGQYYKLSSHSFYAASTLKVDTGKALFTHTVSDSKLRVPHSHPVAFRHSESPEHRWAFLHSLVIWDSWKPGMWAHFSFLFLSCLVKWECLEVWGIT